MKIALIVVSFCLVTTAAAVLQDPAKDRQGHKSFQLVYHSDTRGYYQPCG